MKYKTKLQEFLKQTYYDSKQIKFNIKMFKEELFKNLTPTQKTIFKEMEKLNKKLIKTTLKNFEKYIYEHN